MLSWQKKVLKEPKMALGVPHFPYVENGSVAHLRPSKERELHTHAV